jgi:hypothetical protein
MIPFIWLRQRWRTVVAGAVNIVFLLSLTGVIPQALGGYPAQLNLNNSGLYYDLWTPTTQERSAILWLDRQVGSRTHPTPVQVQADDYADNLVQFGLPPDTGDIFPPALVRGTLVFLPPLTVAQGLAAVSINGNNILYRYPTPLLDKTKNLVYSSKETRVYG